MKAESLIFFGSYLLVAALLVLEPWLARKNVLFGIVFGDAGVWSDDGAKKLRKRYLWESVAAAVVIGAVSAPFELRAGTDAVSAVNAFLISVFILIAAESAVFIAAHHRTRVWKAGRSENGELVSGRVVLETQVEEQRYVAPLGWAFLLLPLFLASAAVAWFGYPAMPSQIPTHYSFTAADAWSAKTPGMVWMPVMIEASLVVVFLLCILFMRRAPASVRGNPQAAPEAFRYRKDMVLLMVVWGNLVELTFLLIEAGFLLPVSPVWFNVLSILDILMMAPLFYLFFRLVRTKRPKGPILDDDAKWALGMFYYDPSDPTLFVEKRSGIGYTLNYGRPGAWIFTFGLIAFVVLCAVLPSVL
jgi:uncharacterized membrane protein